MLNNSDNKQYFIVPLKMSKNSTEKIQSYEIDKKLLKKTYDLQEHGYKQCQPNIIDWLKNKE
jgi:hypothetical protein